jgi:hypothetical protein
MTTQSKSFNLETAYDEEIAPLMTQIIAVCKKHKMPMFATFLYASDQCGDTGSCNTFLMFEERDISQEMLDLREFVSRKSAPVMHLTVRDKDGNATEHIAILP